MFAGTLADDLRLARPDAPDAALQQALHAVGADWARLDAVVGLGGMELTPAQAQQLALARLHLKDPKIAVLDEATAEASSAGARALERAADTVLQGRTALVVAHRLTAGRARGPASSCSTPGASWRRAPTTRWWRRTGPTRRSGTRGPRTR